MHLTNKENIDLTMIIDNASVELFADNGLTMVTEIFTALYERTHPSDSILKWLLLS